METKKMWIIECLDVPPNWKEPFAMLMVKDNITGKELNMGLELISPERLRYGVPSHGDLFIASDERLRAYGVDMAVMDFNKTAQRLIIDPPKPKETVKEVMSRMPDLYDDCWADTMDYEMINILKDWQADLKKAQEG